MIKRWLIGALLAGAATLVAGAPAQAAARHRVNQIDTLGSLAQSANYPGVGSTATYSGIVTSRLGRGAIVETITITGHPTAETFAFSGTSTAFYRHGTTRARFSGTGTLLPDGRFALTGHGRYTGGTLYRHVRRKYAFAGTAPPPPSSPPPAACAVPAGWHLAASDAQVVVIEELAPPLQEYRYCDYAEPTRGFQLLSHTDSCVFGYPMETCYQIDGVALSYILYDSLTPVHSPACGALGPTMGTSTVYAVDTTSGNTMTLAHGPGAVTAAQLSPPGIGAWIVIYTQCPYGGGNQRTETLQTFSFRSGAVTTLDTGDPGETISSFAYEGGPTSLANLQLYQCTTGCGANRVVVAWTHDGTWRYAQTS